VAARELLEHSVARPLFLMAQRFIVAGLTAGAVKG